MKTECGCNKEMDASTLKVALGTQTEMCWPEKYVHIRARKQPSMQYPSCRGRLGCETARSGSELVMYQLDLAQFVACHL